MAEATPSIRIPPGAQSIVRDAQSATTLYTVPAGFILHIVSTWASVNGASTAGSVLLTTTPMNDSSSRVIHRTETGVTTQSHYAIHHGDIPVDAAGTVVSSTAGTAATSFTIGFSGWLEARTK